jgi:hypothetical protein
MAAVVVAAVIPAAVAAVAVGLYIDEWWAYAALERLSIPPDTAPVCASKE